MLQHVAVDNGVATKRPCGYESWMRRFNARMGASGTSASTCCHTSKIPTPERTRCQPQVDGRFQLGHRQRQHIVPVALTVRQGSKSVSGVGVGP